MKRSIITILILSVMGVSCTTTQQTTSTTKTMDIYGPGVIQHPIVGELDVDIDKVQGEAKASGTNVDVSNLKVLAVQNASEKADADILVEPSFEVSEEGSEITVVAEGFPARYTGFRQITEDDIPLLKAGRLQTAEVYEASESNAADESDNSSVSDDNNKLLMMLGFLGAGVGVILLTQ